MSGSPYEKAVLRRRSDPTQADFVRQCYLDAPLDAACRFAASSEFAEVRQLLALERNGENKRVLDVGCGNGIASFAFASLGCEVVAVEPDPSDIVGRGAVAKLLSGPMAGSITCVASPVDEYEDNSNGFDIVYMRQVAHHFPVLEEGIARCVDMLKPGGMFLMTREHVADTPEEVEAFRQNHPGTKSGIRENAYSASRYCAAMRRAGLEKIRQWGPFDSVINFYPAEPSAVCARAWGEMRRRLGRVGTSLVQSIPQAEVWALHALSRRDRTPGRLFTFRGAKPRFRLKLTKVQ